MQAADRMEKTYSNIHCKYQGVINRYKFKNLNRLFTKTKCQIVAKIKNYVSRHCSCLPKFHLPKTKHLVYIQKFS